MFPVIHKNMFKKLNKKNIFLHKRDILQTSVFLKRENLLPKRIDI